MKRSLWCPFSVVFYQRKRKPVLRCFDHHWQSLRRSKSFSVKSEIGPVQSKRGHQDAGIALRRILAPADMFLQKVEVGLETLEEPRIDLFSETIYLSSNAPAPC
jgi:hypothetical protein